MMGKSVSTIAGSGDHTSNSWKDDRRHRLMQLIRDAAVQLLEDIDPWKQYNLHVVPAERVIRHLYHPATQSWTTDETIVKMEAHPFTHGAMRYCYRMKKRSTPPIHATNHHFHKIGWAYASNYVAKAYVDKDGVVDTSVTAKRNIQNDIVLQYEAQHWADQYNHQNPPKKIHFLRAYVIEFPNRVGQPWFAVERYITGTDPYGKSFMKHNTNAGYVDAELRRVTPQIFSAYSFYATYGHRLVADIQGIGDLYTDPQVLSSDERFGEGDLGLRGMAFFLTHFRNCTSSDALGIPIFPLSKNEIRYHQMKYDDDEITLSDDDEDDYDHHDDDGDMDSNHISGARNDDDASIVRTGLGSSLKILNVYQKLDFNRQRRSTILHIPPMDLLPISRLDTMRHSNVTTDRRRQHRNHSSLNVSPVPSLHHSTTTNKIGATQGLPRTKSNVDDDDVSICLERAQRDHIFTYHDFHRHASGELKERHFKTAVNTLTSTEVTMQNTGSQDTTTKDALYTTNERPAWLRSTLAVHKSAIVRNGGIAQPMSITNDTRMNLGHVHYQLAVLHGLGRFPELVAHSRSSNDTPLDISDEKHPPDHDVYTVLFHLSYGASLQNIASCLALGRVQAGLSSEVSPVLSSIVPIDLASSKILLRRAMTSPYFPPSQPKVAAGCLLYQILQDENRNSVRSSENDTVDNNTIEIKLVIQDILQYMNDMEQEEKSDVQQRETKMKAMGDSNNTIHSNPIPISIGDHVEANYALEGTYYPAIVVDVVAATSNDADADDNNDVVHDEEHQLVFYTVRYEDDDSSETLSSHHVRSRVPLTATATSFGEPISDHRDVRHDAYSEDSCVTMKQYELQYKLATILMTTMTTTPRTVASSRDDDDDDDDDDDNDDAVVVEVEEKEEDGGAAAVVQWYETAAAGALADGKMNFATIWSLQASQVRSLYMP
jgi:elongation factor 2 kinase